MLRLSPHFVARALPLLLLASSSCTEAKGPRPAGELSQGEASAPSDDIELAPGVSAKLVASEADVRAARGFYMTRCRVCHGDSGEGNGPMAGTLRPPPRTFVDAKWQQSVRDSDIAAILVQGGARLGRSAAMPASPELEGKPKLLAGLVQVVRGFGEATP